MFKMMSFLHILLIVSLLKFRWLFLNVLCLLAHFILLFHVCFEKVLWHTCYYGSEAYFEMKSDNTGNVLFLQYCFDCCEFVGVPYSFKCFSIFYISKEWATVFYIFQFCNIVFMICPWFSKFDWHYFNSNSFILINLNLFSLILVNLFKCLLMMFIFSSNHQIMSGVKTRRRIFPRLK